MLEAVDLTSAMKARPPRTRRRLEGVYRMSGHVLRGTGKQFKAAEDKVATVAWP